MKKGGIWSKSIRYFFVIDSVSTFLRRSTHPPTDWRYSNSIFSLFGLMLAIRSTTDDFEELSMSLCTTECDRSSRVECIEYWKSELCKTDLDFFNTICALLLIQIKQRRVHRNNHERITIQHSFKFLCFSFLACLLCYRHAFSSQILQTWARAERREQRREK